MKKCIRIIAVICAALHMLPWVFFAAYETYVLCLPADEVHFESQGYAYAFLVIFIGPGLIVAAVGLLGSLLLRKKPKAGSVLMLVAGSIFFVLTPNILFKIPSLLLIIPGALAVSSAKSTIKDD